MTYEQIAELLNGIAERFDWDKIMEGDTIIGLKQVNCLSFVCISFLNLVHIVVYFYHMNGNA
jgi:gamma-glutamylcysteine synthetase